MVGEGGRGPSSEPRHYRFRVPSDDDREDDAPVGGPPLPPDDRLWRHPSELGPLTGPFAPADLAGTGISAGADGRRGGGPWGVAVLAGLVGAALSLGVEAVAGGLHGKVVEKIPVVEREPLRTVAELTAATPGAVGVTKSIAPAIVRVEVTSGAGVTTGSGVLFRNDGYLVTDAELLRNAQTVEVTLFDGRAFSGSVTGIDESTGVAVLKVEAVDLPVAVLGSAIDLQVGQTAVSVGAPIGSSGGPSVTAGVISALGKRVARTTGGALHDMIETDAAAAEGSSGGALCDGHGVLIGITLDVAEADDTRGLGFAAPIDIVHAIAEDLIANGSARHAWLGIEGADADGGARITKVVDNSPAEHAGLKEGDVVAAIDETKTVSMAAFAVALRSHHAGDVVTLAVIRNGEQQTLTATLGERVPS